MAARFSFGVRAPADWRRRLVGVGLITFGLAAVGTAVWASLDAWLTQANWSGSPEAAAIARQVAEPTPIWIPASTPAPLADIQPLPTPKPVEPAAPVLIPIAPPTPTVLAHADELSLDGTDFRFLDPPEPGAHARVAITVSNHSSNPSGRVLMGINAAFFEAYSIIGTAPAVSEDRTSDDGVRTFSFPSIAAGATANFELHVTAIGEGTTAPSVQVLLDDGDAIGDATTPSTFAPEPRPGPVMSIDIPSLKLHSGVVQTEWEAPPFTVGQIKDSAHITEGNTVLIGHLTGAAGNIFAHLDQLKPGDEVTAVSRGLPYKFVVSQTFEAPNNDAAPMQPSDDDKLTLMTCAGIWNPFTHEYSQRLWVVAEPPDQAAVTIANAAATATVQAAATATAIALEPTATPVPTPYAGEPALPGGIGNTRMNVGRAFGAATGETLAKLVVFKQPGREYHVQFTPDPPRAALISEILASPLSFDAAVRESRKLFPSDAQPRAQVPEGNSKFIVERFSSPTLEQALGTGDFSVIYPRDAKGAITSIVLGLGDDYDALIAQSQS